MWRLPPFTVLVACLFLASAASITVQAGESGIQGDADCSGAITPIDGLVVLRHDSGGTAAPCPDLADVQCDGSVGPVDALQLLRYDAGLTVNQPAGCTPIGESVGPPRSSYDLIDEAIDEGEIDEETALLYEFYAAFNDARLPTQYKGDDSGVLENPALKKVPGMWEDLSVETRDLLMPFLRTPPEPDSWYAQTQPAAAPQSEIEWGTVSAQHHPVKVWWETRFPGDETRAQQIASAIDSDIWTKVTAAMQKSPMPDCGASCPSGGGDEKLDIYIVGPALNRAYTSWNPPDQPTCENTPAYIAVSGSDTLSDIAHEFTHAVQFAFPYAEGDGCSEYDWWAEATATAMEDVVYKTANEEHSVAPFYLDDTINPLEHSPDDNRKYGAYVFPFYMARIKNQPAFIGDTFAEFELEEDSVKAIDSALRANLYVHGFDDVWPDFALKNWNRDPVTTYHSDSLQHRALSIPHELKIEEVELDEANLEHLSSVYYKFTFAEDARYVIFTNTLRDLEHASVWAIRKVGGQWKDPEDWSDDSEKKFCRDSPGGELTELVIILANSDGVDQQALSPGELPTLEGKDHCPVEYVGTATYTITQPAFGGQQTITGSVSVTWVPRPDDDTCFGACFQTSGEGQWTWDQEYPVDGGSCHTTGSGVQDILGTMTVFPPGAMTEKASFTGSGTYVGNVEVHTECPGDSFPEPRTLPLWFAACRLDQCTDGVALVGEDGAVAESGTGPLEFGGTIQYSYRFEPTAPPGQPAAQSTSPAPW
jgi:hypothetical protein